jgi:dipeptidase E
MNKLLIMGAGGYTLERASCRIDKYFIERIGKSNPKICLLPTACAERQETIEKFNLYFRGYGATTSHVSLFTVEIEDIESHLIQQDGIYITGGNTKSMLALWKEWGVEKALRKAYEAGVTICGISAGAMCFFEEGLSEFFPNNYNHLDCLGFLSGSFCPHYAPGEERAIIFKDHIRLNKMKPGIGLEDGVALYYENGILSEILRSRDDAQAYRISTIGEPEIIKIHNTALHRTP